MDSIIELFSYLFRLNLYLHTICSIHLLFSGNDYLTRIFFSNQWEIFSITFSYLQFGCSCFEIVCLPKEKDTELKNETQNRVHYKRKFLLLQNIENFHTLYT